MPHNQRHRSSWSEIVPMVGPFATVVPAFLKVKVISAKDALKATQDQFQ